MWHVSSRSSVATFRTAIHLLLTDLLTYACRADMAVPIRQQERHNTALTSTLLRVSDS